MFENFDILCMECGSMATIVATQNVHYDVNYEVECCKCDSKEVKTIVFKWEV